MRIFFFFQAEDGIRDVAVTGVQTCALPIYLADVAAGELREPQVAIGPGGDVPGKRVLGQQRKLLQRRRKSRCQPHDVVAELFREPDPPVRPRGDERREGLAGTSWELEHEAG